MMHLGLWLGQAEDARLFRTLLEPRDIAIIDRPELRPGEQRTALDLAVMDLRSHIDLADQIHACRTAEAPRFLPVLLLVHPSDLYPASRHLGCTADEVVLTPIRRIELRTRVHSLLQGRRMSLELESLHRSRADQALEELRSLRRLESLRDQFIGSVSHELRTPLTTIMGFAELLADGLAGPLGTEARDFVLEIKRAGQRITNLVDELLDDARLQAGTFQVHPEPVDPLAHMRAVACSLGPQLKARNLRLDLDLPGSCQSVMADPRRLDQVLLNLLSNAIRHSPPRGVIDVGLANRDDGIRIEVRDHGPGISLEDRKLLFQRYRQIGPAASGGTGLGLAIARAIVEAHGGRIGVDSNPGRGATFWFWLPTRAQAKEAA